MDTGEAFDRILRVMLDWDAETGIIVLGCMEEDVDEIRPILDALMDRFGVPCHCASDDYSVAMVIGDLIHGSISCLYGPVTEADINDIHDIGVSLRLFSLGVELEDAIELEAAA